jgi:hypothetical protein
VLAPRTKEKEFGLLLTPTSVMTDEPPEKMRARAAKNGYQNGTKYGSLLSQVKYSAMLPAPTTDSKSNRKNNYKQGGTPLTVAISGMLPTPAAQNYKGASSKEALKKRGRLKIKADNLPDQFAVSGRSSQLNPRFVAEMMGFPPNWTELPFQSGGLNLSKDTETQ